MRTIGIDIKLKVQNNDIEKTNWIFILCFYKYYYLNKKYIIVKKLKQNLYNM